MGKGQDSSCPFLVPASAAPLRIAHEVRERPNGRVCRRIGDPAAGGHRTRRGVASSAVRIYELGRAEDGLGVSLAYFPRHLRVAPVLALVERHDSVETVPGIEGTALENLR